MNPSKWASFGKMLHPWLGINVNEVMIKNLPQTLATTAHSTAKTIGVQQISLNSLFKVVSDNMIAADYLLAEQGRVCAIANTSCCTSINISDNVKNQLPETNKQATWLKQGDSSSRSF